MVEQHKGLGLHTGDLSVAIAHYRTTRLHDLADLPTDRVLALHRPV
jgi:hypothetical protein